jgi:hypothetical protein
LQGYSHPVLVRTLDLASRRATGSYTRAELEATRTEYVELYDSHYRGHSASSAKVLAIAAAGSPAFTDDPLNAAEGATDFTARAFAEAAKEADEDHFDEIHDEVETREKKELCRLLKTFLPPDFVNN